jgi:uncharacterized protein (DUF2141 family)
MRIVSTLLLIALASIITACPAQPAAVGKLVVKITGLAPTVPPVVTVSNSSGFKQMITDAGSTTTTISNLPVGSYNIEASDVSPNGTVYKATVTEGSPVTVAADATTTVSVVYAIPTAQ